MGGRWLLSRGMTVVIVTVVTVTEVIFTYLPIWQYAGTVVTVVTVLTVVTEVIKKCFSPKKMIFTRKKSFFIKKNFFLHQKSPNLFTQKITQPPHTKKHCKNRQKLPWELVGCQGVKIVTKLENSNCEKKNLKTQIVTQLKNSNCDNTNSKLWQN